MSVDLVATAGLIAISRDSAAAIASTFAPIRSNRSKYSRSGPRIRFVIDVIKSPDGEQLPLGGPTRADQARQAGAPTDAIAR